MWKSVVFFPPCQQFLGLSSGGQAGEEAHLPIAPGQQPQSGFDY